jgi:type I restriction enzyme S subunit
MSSKQVLPLRSFVSLVRGTTYKGGLVGLPGPVLLGLASIQPDGGFRRGSFKTYGGESPAKITLGPGDVYVSLKDVTQSGDLLGSVARVPLDIAAGRLTQDTVKLQFDGKPISREYVYWLLRTPAYRVHCRSHATGTTTLGLAREDFLGFPVAEPSEEDLSLVELLEALDDRIALLRETNLTLEAIAQALFKSWFIDFDPVRAKQQGIVPTGMDEATAALFPDGFRESEVGDIPRGWSVQPVGEVVACVGGATPDTKDERFWFPAEHAWTSPKDLSGLVSPILLSTERSISTQGLSRIGSGLLPAGTLLLSSRAPIGYLAISQLPLAVNQGYIAMPPGGRLTPLFLLFWCRQNMDVIKSRANGSTFMEISKKAFRPIPVLVPPEPLIASFQEVASPLFARVAENERQARAFATLRDTLLPHLISSQLRLPQADALLEEATA